MNTPMMSADGPLEKQPQSGSLGVAEGSAICFEIARAYFGYVPGAQLAREDREVLGMADDLAGNEELAKLIADARRLDWLADRENKIGNVHLPRECIQSNMHSMRAAIDAAMALPNNEFRDAATDANPQRGDGPRSL